MWNLNKAVNSFLIIIIKQVKGTVVSMIIGVAFGMINGIVE